MINNTLKHIITIIAIVLLAGSIATASSIKPEKTAVSLKNANFSEGKQGWNIPWEYKVEKHGGRNGTPGLVYERKSLNKYRCTSQRLTLKKGIRYRFGAWIKAENVVKGKEGGASICLEFYGKNGFLGGAYPEGVWGTTDWQFVQEEVLVPQQTTKAILSLYLRTDSTGKGYFDDVSIESADTVHSNIYFVQPPSGRVTTKDTTVKLKLYFESPELAKLAEQSDCHLALTIQKTKKQFIEPIKNGLTTLNSGSLPLGKGQLKIQVITKDSNKILAKKTLPLTVIEPKRKIPANSCIIDKRGRSIVNNKPFLPVGIYMGQLFKKDLEEIAKSPFNCLVSYSSMHLRLQPSDKISLATIRETLDYCHNKNIKIIFSLKDAFDKKGKAKQHWMGAVGDDEIVRKVVKEFQSHPALLAWYVNDESPQTMMDQLVERYHLLSSLDPFHPCWAVLYQFSSLPLFGGSCDVIGVDPYPIRHESTKSMTQVDYALDMVAKSALPVWVVPQAFHWGVYEAKENPEEFKKYRFPTEAEIRGMSILKAIRGAKGFIFYSYFDLKSPFLTQADYDDFWPKVCRVGEMLRSLEPFLLSDNEPTKPEIEVIKGDVRASEFHDKAGNVRILIAGIGPGESKAIIKTSTDKPLKSVYGNCRPLGNGKYEFSGQDICSDILSR